MAARKKRTVLERERSGRYFRQRRQRLAGGAILCIAVFLLGYSAVDGPEELRQPAIYAMAGILLLAGGYVLGKFVVHRLKYLRYRNSPLSKIDNMTGDQFEDYLVAKFTAMGYRAKRIGGSYDYGADLLLSKGLKTTVVQAKRYKSRIGISAVQQVVAARAYYKADTAMVVTNSHFTSAAKELAAANNVELWEREHLEKE